MMVLRIDGVRCDMGTLPTIPIGFDIAKLSDVEGARSGRSIDIELPKTPANDALLGASCDVYTAEKFNNEHHTAHIEKDGVRLFEGTAYLRSTTMNGKSGNGYLLRISEGGDEWIDEVVHNTLADLEISFDKPLDLGTIESSWDGEQAVRFLPVTRSGEKMEYSSSMLPVERMMLTEDYHPFISVTEMVQAMFAKTGYKLHSTLLESDFGRSLYMSGRYKSYDGSAAKSRCDFLARRSAPGTTTADFSGRIYASTAFAAHTVGPIVDTANPYGLDHNGEKMSDTFATNNSFIVGEDGNIYFVPKRSAKVGFLLHLEYTTAIKIISRKEFRGFDTVEGLNGLNVKFALANSCKDYRGCSEPNISYRALVFDHTEGYEYQLTATTVKNESSSIGQWSSRSHLVTTPNDEISSLNLYYRNPAESAAWRSYKGDWALYAGYIDEESEMDVVVDIRIPAIEVSSGSRVVLDKFWIGGADPGMKITVGTGTTLRPYFTMIPGYGTQLSFRDIASDEIRQVELLSALGEMFNLVFYTDRVRKEVHIEPMEQFYEGANIVDWNDRIDRKGGVTLADSGLDMPQVVVLSYIAADYATQRFNLENDTTLGRWSFRNPLYGTLKSKRQLGNKLFTTTINATQIVGSAPSASLMQVGDQDSELLGIEAEFAPHIVCYKGLRQLPEGELWNTDSGLDHYPYATFLDEEGTNLCFEERNNTEGLSLYYKPMLQRQSIGQRVTLNLYLTTAEIASLFTADGTKPSLRSLFRFDINGERALYRLAKVGCWDTKSNIVQCTFERDLNHKL